MAATELRARTENFSKANRFNDFRSNLWANFRQKKTLAESGEGRIGVTIT